MKHLYWLSSISFCVLTIAPAVSLQPLPSFAVSTIELESSERRNRIPMSASGSRLTAQLQSGWNVFPVDLTVDPLVTTAVLVRGNQNEGDVDFKNWLLPLDAVIETLALEVTVLDDGWQVRSQRETRCWGTILHRAEYAASQSQTPQRLSAR